ncbi:hypothetical protein QN277_021580 [Acacia crassicarpa]|uniref:Patatin n=1 Tax=Acacia crassicarpa TaxID=499986 RepID=A0AAE1JS35_9FABA|nr:hypothetical protein QN277_021580 [Acacia crassicarpa]
MELSKVTLEIFSKLEQKWLFSRCETTDKTRILSIDGGGTTAVVAGTALVRLEDQIRLQTRNPQAQIADFFDIIAGTGIGAILAAMITADEGSGRPLFTARDAVRVVTQRNSELFKPKLPRVLRWRCRRFSSKSMDKVVKEVFRRRVDGRLLTLKDTCKPLLIPCFDLKSAAPFVFSRADASESPSFNFELWKVCRATSATPSLFKPFQFTSLDGKTSCRAIDGGLVMNNPTAAAVTHVLHNKRDFPSVSGVSDLLVLSIGNGTTSVIGASGRKVSEKEETLCSMSSMVDIVVDGVSETIDQMLGNAFCRNRSDYVRLQALGLGSGEEVLKEKGVESLPFGGKRLLKETNGHRIDSFVQRLVASGKANAAAVNPIAGS